MEALKEQPTRQGERVKMESWNDDRLDELSRRMDNGFTKVEREMKEGFARIERVMSEGFAQANARIGETNARIGETNARIDRLMLTLLVGALGIIGTLIGVDAL